MENNNQETKWITKKELVAPIISITAFLVLLVGASYAYYAVTNANPADVNAISNVNATMPKVCTFIANATDCTITSGASSSTTDSVISLAEMTNESLKGSSVAQATCNLNLNLTGNVGCKCDYTVTMASNGSVFTPTTSGVNEFTAAITGSITVAEANINTITSVDSGTMAVTGSSAVTKTYSMTTRFYNTSAQQQSTIAGITFKYKLSASATCNQ